MPILFVWTVDNVNFINERRHAVCLKLYIEMNFLNDEEESKSGRTFDVAHFHSRRSLIWIVHMVRYKLHLICDQSPCYELIEPFKTNLNEPIDLFGHSVNMDFIWLMLINIDMDESFDLITISITIIESINNISLNRFYLMFNHRWYEIINHTTHRIDTHTCDYVDKTKRFEEKKTMHQQLWWRRAKRKNWKKKLSFDK